MLFSPGNAKQIAAVTSLAREDSKGAHKEHEDRVQKEKVSRRHATLLAATTTERRERGKKKKETPVLILSFSFETLFLLLSSFSPAFCC